jgi:hypothetical protein
MNGVTIYNDLPEGRCVREAPHPECSSPMACDQHPRQRLQQREGGCAAAVQRDGWKWFPCSNSRLEGDTLCWQHAGMRDRSWLPAMKGSVKERVEASRRGTDTPERFYFKERFG